MTIPTTRSGRLHNLDYLRGLAALSIMVYHYCAWTFGRYNAEDVFGRIGLYGVSIFYVLSGLTLYHVYYRKFEFNLESARLFYVKRFFRIFPLLWLTILLSILLTLDLPDLRTLFLNVTGLFGVLDWNNYIGTGVWSIGNELCFYLFFPFFILLGKWNKYALFALGCLFFLITLYFAFNVLPTYEVLSKSGWKDYVNPLNQIFLFFAGFLIGYLFNDTTVSKMSILVLLTVCIITFVGLPVEGDRINLVSGVPRVVLVFVSIGVCFAFFKLPFSLADFIHQPLVKLGEISYGLYLLHPLVWAACGYGFKLFHKLGVDFQPVLKLGICFIASIAVSVIVYTYFEKYFMRLANNFTTATVPAGKKI